MNTEFRTKLRVKRWKYAEALKALIERQAQQSYPNSPQYPMPQPIYPWPTTSKCARCGMERPLNAPWGYCCPEGQMCGVPRTVAPTVFIPQWQPVSQASLQAKADVWN